MQKRLAGRQPSAGGSPDPWRWAWGSPPGLHGGDKTGVGGRWLDAHTNLEPSTANHLRLPILSNHGEVLLPFDGFGHLLSAKTKTESAQTRPETIWNAEGATGQSRSAGQRKPGCVCSEQTTVTPQWYQASSDALLPCSSAHLRRPPGGFKMQPATQSQLGAPIGTTPQYECQATKLPACFRSPSAPPGQRYHV